MTNIELSNREITNPGLYIMRWRGNTGLVRIVGEPKRGFTIIQPEKSAETYMAGLPADGQIPNDALLSDPLSLVAV